MKNKNRKFATTTFSDRMLIAISILLLNITNILQPRIRYSIAIIAFIIIWFYLFIESWFRPDRDEVENANA